MFQEGLGSKGMVGRRGSFHCVASCLAVCMDIFRLKKRLIVIDLALVLLLSLLSCRVLIEEGLKFRSF